MEQTRLDQDGRMMEQTIEAMRVIIINPLLSSWSRRSRPGISGPGIDRNPGPGMTCMRGVGRVPRREETVRRVGEGDPSIALGAFGLAGLPVGDL